MTKKIFYPDHGHFEWIAVILWNSKVISKRLQTLLICSQPWNFARGQQTIKLTKSILRIAVSNIKLRLSITVKNKTSSEVQFMTCEFHMLLAGNCSYLEPIHRQMLSGFCTECWPRASSCLWRGFVKWDLVRGYRHRWLSQNDSGFNLSESVNFIEKFGLESILSWIVCNMFFIMTRSNFEFRAVLLWRHRLILDWLAELPEEKGDRTKMPNFFLFFSKILYMIVILPSYALFLSEKTRD